MQPEDAVSRTRRRHGRLSMEQCPSVDFLEGRRLLSVTPALVQPIHATGHGAAEKVPSDVEGHHLPAPRTSKDDVSPSLNSGAPAAVPVVSRPMVFTDPVVASAPARSLASSGTESASESDGAEDFFAPGDEVLSLNSPGALSVAASLGNSAATRKSQSAEGDSVGRSGESVEAGLGAWQEIDAELGITGSLRSLISSYMFESGARSLRAELRGVTGTTHLESDSGMLASAEAGSPFDSLGTASDAASSALLEVARNVWGNQAIDGAARGADVHSAVLPFPIRALERTFDELLERMSGSDSESSGQGLGLPIAPEILAATAVGIALEAARRMRERRKQRNTKDDLSGGTEADEHAYFPGLPSWPARWALEEE